MAELNISVDGQGTIKMAGDAEFISAMQGVLLPLIFNRHVDAEVAKGRERDDVLREMKDALDKAEIVPAECPTA